jgi:hypothetical protein
MRLIGVIPESDNVNALPPQELAPIVLNTLLHEARNSAEQRQRHPPFFHMIEVLTRKACDLENTIIGKDARAPRGRRSLQANCQRTPSPRSRGFVREQLTRRWPRHRHGVEGARARERAHQLDELCAVPKARHGASDRTAALMGKVETIRKHAQSLICRQLHKSLIWRRGWDSNPRTPVKM